MEHGLRHNGTQPAYLALDVKWHIMIADDAQKKAEKKWKKSDNFYRNNKKAGLFTMHLHERKLLLMGVYDCIGSFVLQFCE